MKKVHVNKSACIGCGSCSAMAEEIFGFDDEGLAYNILGDESEIPEEYLSSVEEAIDFCPTSAIILEKKGS